MAWSRLTLAVSILIFAHTFAAADDIKSQQSQYKQTGEQPELDISDPIEPVNRGIFWFNDEFDRYFLGPVSREYDDVMPEPVKKGVGNFFANLEYPIHLVADVLELDFSSAANDTGRFVVNTTAGVAGVMDVADDWGLHQNKNDIGVALGRDGVGDGFYIVLPLLGPSNLRDAVGRGAAAFVSPTAIMAYSGVDSDVTLWVTVGTRALEFIDTRARMEDAIKTARESSLDYYLFMQSAYTQYRNGLIRNKGRNGAEVLHDEGQRPQNAPSAHDLLNDEDEKQ